MTTSHTPLPWEACGNYIRSAMPKGLLIATCLCTSAHAADYGLVVHGLTHHTAPRHSGLPWNGTNQGLALRYIKDSDWSSQVGGYKDSVFKPTVYGLVDYTPVHALGINFGGFAGVKHSAKTSPVAGVVARWEPGAISITGRFARAPQSGGYVFALEAGVRF